MLTTTKNNLTYIEGHVLGTPVLIQGPDRETARRSLERETNLGAARLCCAEGVGVG